MATAPADQPRLVGLIVAVSVGSAVAHLCTSAMPLQIGALVDGYRLSATGAGFVGFFQVGSLAFSMMLFAPFAHRVRPIVACILGIAVAVSSYFLLYCAPAVLPLLCLLAAAGGCGYGLVLSAAVGAAAAAEQPDRIYAAGNSGSLLIVVGLLSLLPLANGYFGARGIFVGIAMVLLLAMPLVAGFRARRAAPLRPGEGVPRRGGVALLAMWALFSFGAGAMWTFAERIGHALGLPGPEIGTILSVSVFTGLIGTSLAAFACNRMERRTALLIGLLGGGSSCLLLANAADLWIYVAGAILYWVATMYIYVLLLGTAATLDPSGRLGTLGTGCERLAFAVSAPVAGLLVDLGSFRWIGILSTLACVVAAPLCLSPLERALAKTRAVTSALE